MEVQVAPKRKEFTEVLKDGGAGKREFFALEEELRDVFVFFQVSVEHFF